MEDGQLRLVIFIGLIAVMAIWEVLAPLRTQPQARTRRWTVNFGLVVISVLIARITVGGILLLAADWSAANDFGLISWLGLEGIAALAVAVVLLDLMIYAQHVATHKIPILWRLHQVHHSDRGFDVSTAVRFHPIEILLSLLYKAVIVLLLGPEAWMVVIYEAALSGFALFNHGNVSLPRRLEPVARAVIVTPDMHRVHHSVWQPETDSNYGNILSIWDRMFGTYRKAPKKGQTGMHIGLDDGAAATANGLMDVLVLPFRSTANR